MATKFKAKSPITRLSSIRDISEMLTSTRGFSGTGYQMMSIKFYKDRPWLPWQRKLRQNSKTDSAGIENIAVPLAPMGLLNDVSQILPRPTPLPWQRNLRQNRL